MKTNIGRSIAADDGRIGNHMSYKVRDEIIYPFPNFNGCTGEV